MTRNFNCASCSAPLEFAGTPTQKCQYCNSTVIAPTELFYATSSTPFGDFSSLTGKALKIAEIDQLIHEGRKIEAIKVFRETFGVGLAEAKNAVERMERGENVDISGMKVRSSRRATAADIEAVKKVGYTIGGSILASIVITVLLILGIVLAVFYFTWSAIDSKIPTQISATNTGSDAPLVTPKPDMLDVLQVGGKGVGAGKFTDNRHVGVDGEGNIYSSDYSPHRIQVFDADGKFLNQWAPAAGTNLYDLAVDREGNVYVANDRGIFKHEGLSGKLIGQTANITPRGIALTWDQKLLVTTRQAILLLDGNLKTEKEWKDTAKAVDSTFGFDKIAGGGDGTIYALDRHKNEICKFSAEGKFLDRVPTGANSPHAITLDPHGRIVVTDTSNIHFLDANSGEKLKTVDANQAFAVAFDQQGNHAYVAARPYVIKYRLNF